MLIKTKYIDCASKSVFNTWKLPTSAADTSGDIYWSAIVCIQDTGEVWTHGKLYGGFFSNADSNKVSLTIGGTTKILALDGHVQSYTTLTGSGTTADQAILSTGVANKWTLKTLGKNAFSNIDYLPADATAVAAEKVVNAMRFQYNGKDMHSFDGSAARLLNIIQGDNVFITGDSQGNVTIAADPGSDTVNTAGATNLIDKKLFLIGAESQTTSPQTYSNQYVYIGTDNCLYSLGKKVLTEHQAIYNLDLQTQVGDAVTKVTTFDPNAANNSFTLVQGTNVTLIPDATNKKVTISSKDTTYDFYNLIFKQGDTVVDTYKPTTSPNKSFKAGTNVTFTKSGDEITVTTQDTRNTAGATEKLATKLFLTGSLTQTDNPQTYTNSKVYIGTDNKLYSDGKVVSTGDHTHNYAGATTPGGPALKVDLNPSGLLDATYGSYGGILQDSNNGPATGSWSNRIKILRNNTSGYYTELAQAMTGTAGLWHRRNVAGVVSDWTPVIDKANFRTYLDATYVIRGNDPNVLTNYVRYSIASGLTMNWEAGNATPTHIWGAKNSDSSKAYVFNGDNIRAFANAVNRAGDTMTGSLTINSSGSFPSLTLNNKDYQATKCQIGGGLNGDFILRNVTGDTSTDLRFNNESLRYKGSIVWHAGNDGSGSGLDADLLDSYHETAFPRLVGVKSGTWNWNDVVRAGYYKIQAGTITNHPTGVYQYGMAEVITTENHADDENRELQVYYPHNTSDNIGIWIRMHNSATQGSGWGAWKGIPTTTWADNKFLPLAGGTMTGTLKVTEIQTTGGNGLVMYSGNNWTYLGQQAGTTYIRSGETDLQHRYNGTDYKIWDARNLVGLRTEHSHITINHIDSRDTASTPQERGAGVWLDFKTNAKANLTDGGSYTGLLTVRKYGNTTDWTGGKSSQLGFTDNSNLWVRFGTGTAWEAWKQIATTNWADGKFLPLAGGTVTGNIILKGATSTDMSNTNVHPRLRFDNSDGSQTVSFIFTDYDSYRAPAGIKLVGNQGNEWFEAPRFIKTGSDASHILLGDGGHTSIDNFFRYVGQNVQSNWDNITTMGTMRVTEQSITNGPSGAYNYGQLLTFNAGGTLSQIYLPHRSEGSMYIRTGWSGVSQYYKWVQVMTTGNYTSILDERYVKKSGDTMTGKLTSAALAGSIIFKGSESNDITNIYTNNGTLSSLGSAIRNGLRFNWYNTYWYIGNMRGGSTDSLGFGIVNENNAVALRVTSSRTIAPVFTSTVTTGTRPIEVSSTTMCNNLNADLLDGVHLSSLIHYAEGNTYDNTAMSRIIAISNVNLTDGASYGSILQWCSNPSRKPSDSNSDNWYNQLYGATNGRLYFRTRTNGSSWIGWKKVLFSGDSISNADTVDGQHASAFSYKSWWHWSGQSGQPTWLWGGNSENSYYLYNPSNFKVAYAADAGTVGGKSSSYFHRNHRTDISNLNSAISSDTVTFDYSSPTGGPGGWINGFVSVHGSYLSSFIANTHRTNSWYLGWKDNNTSAATSWVSVWHSGNFNPSNYVQLSRLKKARIPGEVVDLFVYKVGSYTCTGTDYTTFKNQLFNSNGRGKSSVTYQPSYSSSTTYTVDLSDFVLAYNAISAYSNGMYTAGAGELETNRVGQSVGANSKTISGLEMPKHAHWFGHYRSDNASDRDVFGPDGGQNHSTNGTTSAGQGGNWRTGYSGSGSSKDWRPKTILVFKMVYMPQSW